MTRTIESFEQVIEFGKHKGKTVKYIIENDPSYLLWIVDSTDIDVSPLIVDAAQESFDDATFGRYE